MQTSIFIAKLIGPIVLVAAIIMLANTRDLKELVHGFLEDRPLIYLSGIFAMLAGLAIVNTHNVWMLGWPVIITILGWVSIFAGVVRMASPGMIRSIGDAMIEQTALIRFFGVVWLLIGLWLSYAGYFSPPILS